MRPDCSPSRGAAGVSLLVVTTLVALAASPAGARAQQGERRTAPIPFRHADHELLDCLVCHETGTPTLQADRRWCSDCHHSRRTATACTSCHSPDELRESTYTVTRTLEFSVGGVSDRGLPFRHRVHESVGCGRCHEGGPTPSASGLDCTECHQEHHSPDADCAACHREAPEGAHPVEAHLTCQGSGCHSPAPLAEPPPRERTVCLACHQAMSDHRPGEGCVECHVLPPPEAASEAGRRR